MAEVKETVTKMEILLPYADKEEAEELARFLESMTGTGHKAFMNFVNGANFYRQFENQHAS